MIAAAALAVAAAASLHAALEFGGNLVGWSWSRYRSTPPRWLGGVAAAAAGFGVGAPLVVALWVPQWQPAAVGLAVGAMLGDTLLTHTGGRLLHGRWPPGSQTCWLYLLLSLALLATYPVPVTWASAGAAVFVPYWPATIWAARR